MPMQSKTIHILLVHNGKDEVKRIQNLVSEVETWRIQLECIRDLKSITHAIGRHQHDVCLIDYSFGQQVGFDMLDDTLAAEIGATQVVMIGCDESEFDWDASPIKPVDSIVSNTFDRHQLERVIRYALERRSARQALEQINTRFQQKSHELQRLALGVEYAGEAIVMSNIEGMIEYVNPAFTRLTGYTRREAIGKNPRFLQSGKHVQSFYEQMWQKILAGDTWSGHVINRHKDGSFYEAQLVITAVMDGEGQVQGFVSVHNNITPLKQAQEKLEQVNRALEQKNRKLAELTEAAHRVVDDVAHDFRTPLTVIQEFATIIADGLGGPVTAPQVEYLEFITSATRDLAQMVDDFLDSSKLKARVLRVDRCPIQVSDIFDSTRPILQARAASKDIQIVEDIPENLGMVFADSEKAKRVIINFVVNAIKFSPVGSEIRLWAAATDTGDIRVGITDQGPGLAANDLTAVFERFKQIGGAQQGAKGFGLGLNIAKELTWLNLGQIHVESELGHGSTFSFTLPPFDRARILNRYFERLAEHDEPLNDIAVLRVQVDPRADAEEIRRFLVSLCYPMDLVLVEANSQSIMVVGCSNEPERWIRRLKREREAKIRKATQSELSSLHIDLLGRLVGPSLTRASVCSAITELTELRFCA